MVTEADETEKNRTEDPVDVRTGHFRVVLPGQKSDVLVQHEFDVDAVPPKPVEIDWHSAETK